jgi:hypothetical protein
MADRSRQLFAIDLLFLAHFPERQDACAKTGQPGLAGTFREKAMGMPGAGGSSPSMVGSYDKGCVIFVFRVGLYELPKLADHPVDRGGVLEITIVSTQMGVLIGRSKPKENDGRMVFGNIFFGTIESEVVMPGVSVMIAAVDRYIASFFVDDIGEDIPGSEGDDPALVFGAEVQEFEDIPVLVIEPEVGI